MSDISNAEKQAYPRAGYEHSNLADHQRYYHEDGLTKREMFAMAAMQGMLASCNGTLGDYAGQEHLAKIAVTMADALLKQLE